MKWGGRSREIGWVEGRGGGGYPYDNCVTLGVHSGNQGFCN